LLCLFPAVKEIPGQIVKWDPKGWKGIDMVDNNIRYTKENSVSCCKLCNNMKRDSDMDDFVKYCKNIFEYYKTKEFFKVPNKRVSTIYKRCIKYCNKRDHKMKNDIIVEIQTVIK
jgi:hypothetical protein